MVSTLRTYFRQQRNALSASQQAFNSSLLCRHLTQFLNLKQYKKIAVYLPNDGEISNLGLTHIKLNKAQFFLPVLAQLSFKGLQFAAYSKNSRFKNNRFSIKEPIVANARLLNAADLDIIFLPLVAFDDSGNRIGMGGGFYDRALKIRQRRKNWRKPLLIGLAHSVQQAAEIKTEAWDIPLDGIATENGITLF